MSNDIQGFLDRLIEYLCSIKVLQDYGNRTILLRGLPSGPKDVLPRDDAALAADLRIIVENVFTWGIVESGDNAGEHALKVVMHNVRTFVEGTELDRKLREFENEFSELMGSTKVIFTNRRREIADIYSSSVLFQTWAIDGPSGYGKTWLMLELKKKYESEEYRKWACGYVKIPMEWGIRKLGNEIAKSFELGPFLGQPKPETMGRTLAGLILGSKQLDSALFKGIGIFIDGIDMLGTDTLKELPRVISGIREGLDNAGFWQEHNRFRVFFGGRYISHRLKDIATPYVLSPFNFKAVQETVREYALRTKSTVKNADQVAANLLYVTGGHPGAMAQLLDQMTSTHFSNASDVLEEEQESQQIIKDVISNLEGDFTEKGGSPDIFSILQTLSVFRRYRASWLLSSLVDQGLISWDDGSEALERVLQDTRLVEKDDGFLRDDITRRLLVIHMRSKDKEVLCQICRAGLLLYESHLDTPRKPEIIAVEWLYQKLQCWYFCQDLREDALKEDLEKAVTRVLKTLKKMEEGQDRIGDLLKELEGGKKKEEDWEFKFLYNFFSSQLMGCPYSAQPYEEFIEQIRSFQQEV